jgi:hypothetical protein
MQSIMPRVTLRVNPSTRTARVKKLTLKKPQLKENVFPPRRPSKSYKRKKPNMPVLLQPKVQFSASFAKKNIQYVAMIMCHGSSCDSIHRCENPRFETKYDLILTSPHGTATTTHGPPHEVYRHLCNRYVNAATPLTGKSFMNALSSTINYHETFDLGKLHKNATLKQRDQGTNVADLNIFMSGLHTPSRVDGIYLFEVGKPCETPHDHNVMTVNPALLLQTHPELLHVAQTAMNLQSFIEPTEVHGVRHPQPQDDKVVAMDWMDVQYQLKENHDNVRLSDVVGKEGIFPPNTVVIAYVCRVVHSLPRQALHSPTSSVYTSASSMHSDADADADAESFLSFFDDEPLDDDVWSQGGAMKKKKNRKSLKKRRRYIKSNEK